MAEPTLSELIREKQRLLQHLEAEVRRLQGELQEARLELLGPVRLLAPRRPSPTTSMEMAQAVLQQTERHPLHVNQILSAIERDYQVNVRYATLVGNLSRHIKNGGKVFTKVAPNVFGLAEWEDEKELEYILRAEAAAQEGEL